MTGWAVIAERHVVPLDDLREHITDASCWCAPTADTDDGKPGALYVHHSADHREHYENAVTQ